MTDDNNNRIIANWLEPVTSLPIPQRFAKATYWIASNAGPWEDGSTTVEWYWEPLDFLGDEVANAMLCRAMLATKKVRISMNECGTAVQLHYGDHMGFCHAAGSADHKTGVVRGALKLIEAEL